MPIPTPFASSNHGLREAKKLADYPRNPHIIITSGCGFPGLNPLVVAYGDKSDVDAFIESDQRFRRFAASSADRKSPP